jgi:hypothetical protein
MLRKALFPSLPDDESVQTVPDENPIDTSAPPAAVGNSQVLIATHNPLMISAHPRTHVRILDRTALGTTALPPEDEPPGMSIDRLLTSDVFGLVSALPARTLKTIADRDRLVAKSDLSEEEKLELDSLSDQLEELGLLRTFRLPEEQEFIDAMRRRERKSILGLTPDEVRARNERADAILDQIFSEEE